MAGTALERAADSVILYRTFTIEGAKCLVGCLLSRGSEVSSLSYGLSGDGGEAGLYPA